MDQNFRPSVCIDAVFENQSPEDALAHVRDAGIPAFEFWAWWNRDLERLQKARETCQLDISAFCTKFISLVDPTQREAYLQALQESLHTARDLGCRTLISQVGDALPGVDREVQQQSLIDGLRDAVSLLEGTDVTLVIEPLNELVDHAGYYLIRSDEASDIVERVNCPQIKFLFDIYHQQISEGHLITNLTKHIDRIGHFHAAGNPGRNELTRGEIHYPAVFEAIRSTPYRGYVGLEYWPLEDPPNGLREAATWFK